jgi:hypothetical protein
VVEIGIVVAQWEKRMQVIVFQEGELWVGQCIQKDLAVQSTTEEGVVDEFRDLLKAYKELNFLIENLPATPQSVIDGMQGVGKVIDISENLN